MKIGLFLGRFQPFHLGHLSVIQTALKEVDFLKIGIGSTQYSNEPMNPFSKEERKETIELALKEKDIPNNKYEIFFIPDIHDSKKWPNHVRSIVGDFNMLYLGNEEIVKQLFEKHSNVQITLASHIIPICSTDIRNQIIKDEEWKKCLAPSTIKYLKKIDGINRIKGIYEKSSM